MLRMLEFLWNLVLNIKLLNYCLKFQVVPLLRLSDLILLPQTCFSFFDSVFDGLLCFLEGFHVFHKTLYLSALLDYFKRNRLFQFLVRMLILLGILSQTIS